jgi:rapamycin-insensitive companion of mTOR
VLKLANYSLPISISSSFQTLPDLITSAVQAQVRSIPVPTEIINQVDRVNRTLQRSSATPKAPQRVSGRSQELGKPKRQTDVIKPKLDIDIDELQFRSLILQTQVLTTVNYLKWKWDLIHDLVEGPLLNPKRLEEAIKATKFLKRLIGFYRPFKYRFSDIRNTKPNQRYVRIGCALVKTLLQNTEGIVYLSECKLLRQLAECLAQLDKVGHSQQRGETAGSFDDFYPSGSLLPQFEDFRIDHFCR